MLGARGCFSAGRDKLSQIHPQPCSNKSGTYMVVDGQVCPGESSHIARSHDGVRDSTVDVSTSTARPTITADLVLSSAQTTCSQIYSGQAKRPKGSVSAR